MKIKIYIPGFLVIMGFMELNAQNTITVAPGENLITAIENAGDGDTVVIQAGIHVARYKNIAISKSIAVRAEGPTKPVIYINQLDITGEGVDLYFGGLEISGAIVDSLTGVDSLETLEADYFINLHTDLVSCGDIIIQNCIIRNLNRSVIRGDRSAYTVDNIIVDDCIIYDLRGGGDYGPFRFKSNIKFNNFTITNCTFYNILDKLIDNQDTPSYPMEFLIRNCTFYKWGGGKTGQYLFDIEDNDQAVLKIEDCIFGKTNDDPLATTPITVNGFRFLEAAYTQIMTTVMTPDFILTAGTYEGVAWDVNEYNEVGVDPDWANPEAGDFTLPLESPLLEMSQVGGIIGDPRWDPNAASGLTKVTGKVRLSIYPNPAADRIRVELDIRTNSSDISIYDIIGKKVLEFTNVSGNTYLDISKLQSGVYFVRLNNINDPAVKLVVK